MSGRLLLRLRARPPVPLEAESIAPDRLAGLSVDEIERLPLFCGNRQVPLGEFFAVRAADAGATQAPEVVIEGDCATVKGIGSGMAAGRIRVCGNAGMHLGAGMSGGEIDVEGDAGDWAGAEMSGGIIRVAGSAGHLAGAAYRGSPRGMTGGAILIGGRAGNEVGAGMRRGIICVARETGDFAGVAMGGGTIVVGGEPGARAGAWARRGTIVAYRPTALLPTFVRACAYRPVFLRLYLRWLRREGASLPDEGGGRYVRFTGDTAVEGKGEVFVWEG